MSPSYYELDWKRKHKANEMFAVLVELQQILATINLYEQNVDSAELYARFIDMLNDNGINLEDLKGSLK